MAKNDSDDQDALSRENSSEDLAPRDRDAPLTRQGPSEYNTLDIPLSYSGATLVTSGAFIARLSQFTAAD